MWRDGGEMNDASFPVWARSERSLRRVGEPGRTVELGVRDQKHRAASGRGRGGRGRGAAAVVVDVHRVVPGVHGLELAREEPDRAHGALCVLRVDGVRVEEPGTAQRGVSRPQRYRQAQDALFSRGRGDAKLAGEQAVRELRDPVGRVGQWTRCAAGRVREALTVDLSRMTRFVICLNAILFPSSLMVAGRVCGAQGDDECCDHPGQQVSA